MGKQTRHERSRHENNRNEHLEMEKIRNGENRNATLEMENKTEVITNRQIKQKRRIRHGKKQKQRKQK